MVYIIDLDSVHRAHKLWSQMFPAVRPYYAVKCCPDPMVVQTLFECGAAFDCASPAEVDMVKDKSRIIYANPCKRPEDIEYVRGCGVRRTTFDSVCELEKLGAGYWDLIMRIKADDPMARCPMGNKFGADESDWAELAQVAPPGSIKGVSFHVGSFAGSADAHALAIAKARRAFTLLESFGHTPTVLDIGGGFSSENLETILPVSAAINVALVANGFGTSEVIAEPGRFFVEHAIELHTKVVGLKPGCVTVDDSLYGAFNCVVMDHARPVPRVTGPSERRTVFGCTCDGADVIGEALSVPAGLKVGDVVTWPRMGAYTLAAVTSFNGLPFDRRQRVYIGASYAVEKV